MPTNRRRLSRSWGGVAEGLSEAAYEFYTFGPFFDGEEWAAVKAEAELDAFWKAHREAIMSRFLKDLRLKGVGWEGNRPDFFWREIKEKRRKTGTREYFKPWGDREKHYADVFETDFEFLKRLNLLESWELNAHKGQQKGGKKK
jgi:hypothetical protein